jgi:hypothetical protein
MSNYLDKIKKTLPLRGREVEEFRDYGSDRISFIEVPAFYDEAVLNACLTAFTEKFGVEPDIYYSESAVFAGIKQADKKVQLFELYSKNDDGSWNIENVGVEDGKTYNLEYLGYKVHHPGSPVVDRYELFSPGSEEIGYGFELRKFESEEEYTYSSPGSYGFQKAIRRYIDIFLVLTDEEYADYREEMEDRWTETPYQE